MRAPAGAELLVDELSALDHIPGIDMPEAQPQEVPLEGLTPSQERNAKAVEEQNAEFDEEADRLFGGDSESEEASEEEEEEEEEVSHASEQMSGAAQPESDAAESPSEQLEGGIGGFRRHEEASDLQSAQAAARLSLDKSSSNPHEAPSEAVVQQLKCAC